jgi:hypothetical protein
MVWGVRAPEGHAHSNSSRTTATQAQVLLTLSSVFFGVLTCAVGRALYASAPAWCVTVHCFGCRCALSDVTSCLLSDVLRFSVLVLGSAPVVAGAGAVFARTA